ncbi:MAG TPA: CAP domain-containing protein [Chloroflexota bacterium]|nr:CAP domain-containing protein [Chloroflexota bacterium]
MDRGFARALLYGAALLTLIMVAAMPVTAEARPLAESGATAVPAEAPANVVAMSSPGDSSALSSLLPASPEQHPAEANLLDLLNSARVERGLATLQLEPRLMALARQRSADLVTRNYFSHTTPEGTTVFDAMDKESIPYLLAGENLGRCNYPLAESAQVVHQAFLKSPDHAENELDPSFNKVGIGMAVAPNGFVYYTELFAQQ